MSMRINTSPVVRVVEGFVEDASFKPEMKAGRSDKWTSGENINYELAEVG